MKDKPARLLDGAEYHNAASHSSPDGLRERFAKLNPEWNKKPKPKASVTPIKGNLSRSKS